MGQSPNVKRWVGGGGDWLFKSNELASQSQGPQPFFVLWPQWPTHLKSLDINPQFSSSLWCSMEVLEVGAKEDKSMEENVGSFIFISNQTPNQNPCCNKVEMLVNIRILINSNILNFFFQNLYYLNKVVNGSPIFILSKMNTKFNYFSKKMKNI